MALKRRLRKIILLLVIVAATWSYCGAKKQKSYVTDIKDAKEFKKLLKARTNILVLFVNEVKASQKVLQAIRNTAELVQGQATVCILECLSSEHKKLCKKYKIPEEKPFYIKHFRNGNYHKDYDRSLTVNSMVNFLRDPTGDLPWDEDPTATAISHLSNGEVLKKFLRKTGATNKRCMIMFYAPWCGYCKILKPDFLAAATELKGEAFFAAIDVSKPGNTKVRMEYNITGFPTLLYFEKGVVKFPYNGDNSKEIIVEFMRSPSPALQLKKQIEDTSWSNSHVVQLTDENFDTTLAKAEHALVVFYAPWCGHCKRVKPELEKAAAKIKKEKSNGIIASVDATKQSSLANKFGIRAYPTLKYFKFGTYQFDAGHVRQEEQIVGFMKNPQEPPPPPPPEEDWEDRDTVIRHLNKNNYKTILLKTKHALVAFHAPWCRHCKTMRPEYELAAQQLASEPLVALCAVDCTKDEELCKSNDIKAYPTFKYFSNYNRTVLDYTGTAKASSFVSFIHTQAGGALAPLMSVKQKTSDEIGFGPNVIIATDRDFETIINRREPTFVMFFASWCDACSRVKPEYNKLANALKDANSPTSIVAVDASENSKVADVAKVSTLPVFKLYKNGKLEKNYERETTFEKMLDFCKSNEKVNEEL